MPLSLCQTSAGPPHDTATTCGSLAWPVPAQGAQIPFSIGRRACLGVSLATAESKVLLSVLARGYDVQVEPGSVSWELFPFQLPHMDARVQGLG